MSNLMLDELPDDEEEGKLIEFGCGVGPLQGRCHIIPGLEVVNVWIASELVTTEIEEYLQNYKSDSKVFYDDDEGTVWFDVPCSQALYLIYFSGHGEFMTVDYDAEEPALRIYAETSCFSFI